MKYVVVRCEDRAAGTAGPLASLLEAAKLSHLQEVAQAGAVGRIARNGTHGPTFGWRQPPAVTSDFPAHWTWLGYHPADVTSNANGAAAHPFAWEAGRCYAASRQLELAEDEIAWCCELVTQHDGRLIDPTAGRIPTREAERILETLNQRLATSDLRWVSGEGPHHILVIRRPAWRDELSVSLVPPPEHVVGRSWRKQLPAGAVGRWLRTMTEQAAALLERHDVNRVRVDLGENPANMIWLWGPSTNRALVSFQAKHGLAGAVVAPQFPFQGLARVLGLTWVAAPMELTEAGLQRLNTDITKLLVRHDWVYVVIRIEQHTTTERQCAMERLDQHLFKPLTEHAIRNANLRCVVAVDDRRSGTIPFAAIGADLPSYPAVRLTSEAAGRTPLSFHDGAELFRWLAAATG